MNRDSKGFSAPVVILLAVVIMVIGLVGYRIVKTNSTAEELRNSDKTDTSDSARDSHLADAAELDSSDALDDDTSGSENSVTSGQEATDPPKYAVIAKNDNLTFEIRSKSYEIWGKVEYRLSGGLSALGSAVDIGLIDSNGNYRNIAGLILNEDGVQEGSVLIPDQVYDCKFITDCPYILVPTAKGTGKLIVTHAPTHVVDISVPIEIQ